MVLFWAIGVVPAAVVTALRGRWMLFLCGWLTLGLLWFVGALAPDPEGPPQDPRWMLVAPAIAAAMLVLGIFGARPAPVLGLDGEVLQGSVGDNILFDFGGCEPQPDGGWRCSRYDAGSSGAVGYEVHASGLGCWHGVRVGGGGGSSRKRISGCVTLYDYVF